MPSDAVALPGRRIAINPVSERRDKLLFRALAFVHLQDLTITDSAHMLLGGEVELVALLCCAALGLKAARDIPMCVWRFIGSNAYTEEAAQRILQAAGDILNAGCPPAS